MVTLTDKGTSLRDKNQYEWRVSLDGGETWYHGDPGWNLVPRSGGGNFIHHYIHLVDAEIGTTYTYQVRAFADCIPGPHAEVSITYGEEEWASSSGTPAKGASFQMQIGWSEKGRGRVSWGVGGVSFPELRVVCR